MSRIPEPWTRLARSHIGKAARDERGVTAVLFALAIAVMVPLTLGAFDIYVTGQQRGKLQDALDAAALYAARSSAQTDAAIDPIGDQVLLANLRLIPGAELKTSSFSIEGPTVVATASVKLAAFAPAPWNSQPIAVRSEVQRSMDKLEVALILDNTGSMVLGGSSKLSTLKTEAKKLVDKLAAAAARSADPNPIKIALVPFSNTVRVVGTTDVSGYDVVSHSGGGVPSWIDGRARAHWMPGRSDIFSTQYTDRFQMLRNINRQWAGCVESRHQPYDITETPPSPGDPDTLFAPYFWPDEARDSDLNDYLPDALPNGTDFMVAERNALKYVSTATMTSGNFSFLGMTYAYGPNAGCTLQPMIRLTTDTGSIKTAIENMTAIGETNVPLGMMWGWHALTPNAPLGDGSAYNTPHLRKIAILMTDGENTFYDSDNANGSSYGGLGFIWQKILGQPTSSTLAQRTAAMDARLTQLCTNMKAQKIEIYTIGLEVNSSSATLLRNCATSPDKYYDVTSGQLGAAFDAIAGAIANLRISK